MESEIKEIPEDNENVTGENWKKKLGKSKAHRRWESGNSLENKLLMANENTTARKPECENEKIPGDKENAIGEKWKKQLLGKLKAQRRRESENPPEIRLLIANENANIWKREHENKIILADEESATGGNRKNEVSQKIGNLPDTNIFL